MCTELQTTFRRSTTRAAVQLVPALLAAAQQVPVALAVLQQDSAVLPKAVAAVALPATLVQLPTSQILLISATPFSSRPAEVCQADADDQADPTAWAALLPALPVLVADATAVSQVALQEFLAEALAAPADQELAAVLQQRAVAQLIA